MCCDCDSRGTKHASCLANLPCLFVNEAHNSILDSFKKYIWMGCCISVITPRSEINPPSSRRNVVVALHRTALLCLGIGINGYLLEPGDRALGTEPSLAGPSLALGLVFAWWASLWCLERRTAARRGRARQGRAGNGTGAGDSKPRGTPPLIFFVVAFYNLFWREYS